MNYRYLILPLLLLSLITISTAAPIASFTSNKTHIFAGQAVQFNDTSTGGPTSWEWLVYGVGAFTNDTVKNPVQVFINPGTYSIDLTVTNGSSSHILATDYITVYATSWNWTTPGNYTWTAPTGTGTTTVTADIWSGGGAGQGERLNNAGSGGLSNGQSYSSIPFVEGATYTIHVGKGAAGCGIDELAGQGESSYFGSYLKPGGMGGAVIGSNKNGTAGQSGLSTGGNAAAGGDATPYVGGAAGQGFGAGGGGGAEALPTGKGLGGKGSDGIVRITISGFETGNSPNFAAAPRTGAAGTLISFTDISTIRDSTNLVYNWSFGDGDYSSTTGNVQHVYTYVGSYTVTLTITSGSGTITETKEAYINLVSQQSILPTQPKSVRFKIVDAYGNPLPGATVTASYINNTLPSNDVTFLSSAFGIPLSVAQTMANSGVAMSGITDTNGGLSFIMYPVLQYQIVITNATAGLSKTVTIAPQDTDYIVKCPLTSQLAPVMASTYLQNSSLYITEPNASWIIWNMIYTDPSGHTTGLTWNVTCWNNQTVMHSQSWGAVGAGEIVYDNYTFPSEPKGMEYKATYDAIRDIP